MKMRKLLASGVAASVAVTSLATFASAEEKVWDMGSSALTVNSSLSVNGDINPALGASADQADMQFVKIQVGGLLTAFKDKNDKYAVKQINDGSKNWDTGVVTWTDGGDGAEFAQQDFDWASAEIIGSAVIKNEWYSKPVLTVKGYKIDEKGNKIAVTKEYTMNADWDERTATGTTFSIAVLKDTENVYRDGEFAPQYFDIIETINFKVDSVVTTDIKEQGVYNAIKALGDGFAFDLSNAAIYAADGKTLVTEYEKDYSAITTKLAGETDNKAAAMLAYAITNGGYKVSTASWLEGSAKTTLSLDKKYPFIAEKWTDVDGARVVKRTDVQLLSTTGDHISGGATGADGNQSYVGEDTTQGTDPKDFAGLASQFAEFFNKQTNGTVTFKFTTPSAAGSSNDWVTGGIPSTETGIKNALNGASANDFALFINYRSTGSLQALASIDAAAGTVSFDVSDILDAMGGQTIGVVNDVYFGLATGVDYGDVDNDGDKEIGLFVENITFAYDEDADADLDVEDDTADDDAEEDDDVEDDTADDDADEDDDASIDEDDDDADEDDDADDADDADDDDTDVAGDVVTGGEDDDTNPATGVALAVVPALVAAAAAVVSKKRK